MPQCSAVIVERVGLHAGIDIESACIHMKVKTLTAQTILTQLTLSSYRHAGIYSMHLPAR